MNRRDAFLHRKLGMEALGDDAPAFTMAVGRVAEARDDYVVRLPVKRSVPAILIAFVFLAVFSVPLFTVDDFFAGSGDGSLFSLVFTLFWMLGWSSGALLLLLLFLCLVMGRETLHASRDSLTIGIGIPGIALAARYSPQLIGNIRYIEGDIIESRRWRGPHIAFDYGGMDIGVGSNLDGTEAQEIISRLTAYLPLYDAAPVAIAQAAIENREIVIEKTEGQDFSDASSRPPAPVRWYSMTSIVLICANLIPPGRRATARVGYR